MVKDLIRKLRYSDIMNKTVEDFKKTWEEPTKPSHQHTSTHNFGTGQRALTHAYYNPMDLARNLEALGKTTSAARKSKSFGRPESVSLSTLAELTGMSEKSISQYLQLLRLPEDVQTMVGAGKLKLSCALILLRLDKTASRHMIPKLAKMLLEKD